MARNSRPPHPRGARVYTGKTRPFALHKHNRAGSKMLRRFCEAKFGKRVNGKRITAKQTREWYRALKV